MKRLFLFFSLLLLFTSGCNFRKREDDLQKREAMLNQKEQELLLKEKTLNQREIDLTQREQKADSTSLSDSTHQVNPVLVGIWSVKMTCTETTCPGSAVGDTKLEQWDISYQAKNIIAKATVNEELARTYTGFFTGNTVELVQESTNLPAQVPTRMVVRLRVIDDKHMEGQREIVRDNNCKIVYDLQLEKQ